MTITKVSPYYSMINPSAPVKVKLQIDWKALKASPARGSSIEQAQVVAVTSDVRLQSCHSHRRYMRRGSRAPHMFEKKFIANRFHFDQWQNDTPVDGKKLESRCSTRRLSFVSLLSEQLQNTMLTVNETQTEISKKRQTTNHEKSDLVTTKQSYAASGNAFYHSK